MTPKELEKVKAALDELTDLMLSKKSGWTEINKKRDEILHIIDSQAPKGEKCICDAPTQMWESCPVHSRKAPAPKGEGSHKHDEHGKCFDGCPKCSTPAPKEAGVDLVEVIESLEAQRKQEADTHKKIQEQMRKEFIAKENAWNRSRKEAGVDRLASKGVEMANMIQAMRNIELKSGKDRANFQSLSMIAHEFQSMHKGE